MNSNVIMKIKCTCLALFMFWTMTAKSADILKELACHDEVVREGLRELILPLQVESLFGASNVDHFISDFGSKTEAPIWNSVAYFAGRYRLSLQLPILIDYNKCKLIGATNSAIMQINEVTKVDFTKSGSANVTLKGQWRLNENEWEWLVKNGGEWSVVKIPILTNAAVKGFEEYANQERQPIRNRKEGFDEPVRRALEGLNKQQNGTNDGKK